MRFYKIAILTCMLLNTMTGLAAEKSRFTGDGENVDFMIEGENNTYTLFIADKETNEPLLSAEITLAPDDEGAESISFAATGAPGIYTAFWENSLPEGNLVVTGAVEDEVEVYKDEHSSGNSHNHEGHDHSHGGAKSSLPKVSGGLVLGFAGVFFIGLVFGRILGRSRSVDSAGIVEVHLADAPNKSVDPKVIASGIAVFLLIGSSLAPNIARAGEGHSHGEMSVETRGGDRETFVSKKSQFLLGLRTQKAALSVPEQSIQTIGHAGVAPMFDATIKAPTSGEFRPARQLQIGAKVNKGEILGWIDGIGSVSVKAPISGHIMSLDIFAGLRTENGNTLMRITDSKVLWIDAEVFQQDLTKIKDAKSVFAFIDGRKIQGKVVTFQTNVSEQTLSGKVFIEIDNFQQSVTVGSAGTVSFITGSAEMESFVMPKSAVLFRGAEAIVYTQTGPETFEQKVVTFEPGATPDQVIIKSGIEPGDRVVVSGNYQLLTAAH